MIRRACVVAVALVVGFVPSVMAEEDEERKLKHFVFRGYLSWFSATADDNNVGTTTPLLDQVDGTIQQIGSVCELGGGCATLSLGEGSGFQANFEFRATHLIGVEIGGTTHEIDGQFFANEAVQTPGSPVTCETTLPGDPSTRALDLRGCSFVNRGGGFDKNLSTNMVYVGANFHVWKKNSALDVYVGPFYSFVQYDDGTITTESGEGFTYDIDDEQSWGINGGFDYTIGKRWFVGASLRFVASAPDTTLASSNPGRGGVSGTLDVDPLLFSVGGGIKF